MNPIEMLAGNAPCVGTSTPRQRLLLRGSSSKQRGATVLHKPRLLSDYGSLDSHFKCDTDGDIEDVIWNLNTTPRKCLNYSTPIEAFAANLGVVLEM